MASLAEMFGSKGVETFFGLPKGDLAGPHGKGAIIGVPSATPYASVGPYCAGGPAAIRAAMAPDAANLNHVDMDAGVSVFPDGVATVTDCGDLPFDAQDFAANRARIREAVTGIIGNGAVAIVLGGDDSVPIPMIEAVADQGPCAILQIDAHLDWRNEVQGERFGLSSTMRRSSELANVKAIVQVGQRSVGSARPQDLADAEAWGAVVVPAREVARDGIARAVAAIPEGARLIIALDLDALDQSVAPGVIGRAPGGLTYWQVVELIEAAAARARLTAFNLVEFMPERDVDGLAGLTAARIVANVVRLAARTG